VLSSYLYNSIRPLLVSHGVPMVPQKANPQRLLAIRQAGIAHAAQRRSQALACCQPVPSKMT